ncbi:hypothetical protein GGF32_004092 [Allomyces javanicus]|nr:hypothetical protein GGF32_004092 [Allomyces javanicus]
MKQLIDQHGADIHSRDENGWSALAWAVCQERNGAPVLLEILEMTTLNRARAFLSDVGKSLVDIALLRGCVANAHWLLLRGIQAVSKNGVQHLISHYVDLINYKYAEFSGSDGTHEPSAIERANSSFSSLKSVEMNDRSAPWPISPVRRFSSGPDATGIVRSLMRSSSSVSSPTGNAPQTSSMSRDELAATAVAVVGGDVAGAASAGPEFGPLNFGDAPTEILAPSDEEGSIGHGALDERVQHGDDTVRGAVDVQRSGQARPVVENEPRPAIVLDFGDASTQILDSSDNDDVAGPGCGGDAVPRDHHAHAVIEEPAADTMLLDHHAHAAFQPIAGDTVPRDHHDHVANEDPAGVDTLCQSVLDMLRTLRGVSTPMTNALADCWEGLTKIKFQRSTVARRAAASALLHQFLAHFGPLAPRVAQAAHQVAEIGKKCATLNELNDIADAKRWYDQVLKYRATPRPDQLNDDGLIAPLVGAVERRCTLLNDIKKTHATLTALQAELKSAVAAYAAAGSEAAGLVDRVAAARRAVMGVFAAAETQVMVDEAMLEVHARTAHAAMMEAHAAAHKPVVDALAVGAKNVQEYLRKLPFNNAANAAWSAAMSRRSELMNRILAATSPCLPKDVFALSRQDYTQASKSINPFESGDDAANDTHMPVDHNGHDVVDGVAGASAHHAHAARRAPPNNHRAGDELDSQARAPKVARIGCASDVTKEEKIVLPVRPGRYRTRE